MTKRKPQRAQHKGAARRTRLHATDAQSRMGLAAAYTESANTYAIHPSSSIPPEGSRMLLTRVRTTASTCPDTHVTIASLPPRPIP